ncbi:hypothetical protein DFP72DRAFT_1046534 [Ephemerocybe angulata]|uniref:Uncharacterized protein n=1 Tax=Ephemerocybe angulata TaxID=980116 RepID=A0A8H6HUB1_9AGAR|nr:hypothetical protein DFP72DRAFT_1046534 [Tulosesus angulatus]
MASGSSSKSSSTKASSAKPAKSNSTKAPSGKKGKEKPATPAELASQNKAAMDQELDDLLKRKPRRKQAVADTPPPTSSPAGTAPASSQSGPMESDKDKRIRELEALLQMAPEDRAAQSKPGMDVVCVRPKGEPGRSGNGVRPGFNLQEAMKVSPLVYDKILRATRAAMDTFGFDPSLTYGNEDVERKSALQGLASIHLLELTTRFPFINKRRYPRLWCIKDLAQCAHANRRGYKRKVASGKIKKVERKSGKKMKGKKSVQDSREETPAPAPSDSDEVPADDQDLMEGMYADENDAVATVAAGGGESGSEGDHSDSEDSEDARITAMDKIKDLLIQFPDMAGMVGDMTSQVTLQAKISSASRKRKSEDPDDSSATSKPKRRARLTIESDDSGDEMN